MKICNNIFNSLAASRRARSKEQGAASKKPDGICCTYIDVEEFYDENGWKGGKTRTQMEMEIKSRVERR